MRSKYFKIYELVPEHLFIKLGKKALRFIDSRLIESIDTIKERFPKGTMTINNYKWKGNRNWSGLRTPDSPYYSETSMHSFGNAVDAVFSEYSVDEIRNDIINNPDIYPHIKGLEMETNWLHCDTRNEDKIQLFYP